MVRITSGGCSEVATLQSDQEEADARIVLHAKAAADHGAKRIVVSSPDSDVQVLLPHPSVSICYSLTPVERDSMWS